VRERSDQQAWITKLVLDATLALGDVDGTFRPVAPLRSGLRAPRLFLRLLLILSIHAIATEPAFMTPAKGTPRRGGLSTQYPSKRREKKQFGRSPNHPRTARVKTVQTREEAGASEAAGMDAFAPASRQG